MIQSPHLIDEEDRLTDLRSLSILDSPTEERYERYTRLAQRIFDVPYAYISLVDEDRQWLKSRQGLDAETLPREGSFCAQAILHDEILTINDATKDPRFSSSEVVTGPLGIQFYAGCPIKTPRGHNIGTLCIADKKPREFSSVDLSFLSDLSRLVEEEFVILSLATIDELTSLSNRRGFLSIAEHSIAICRRMKRPATLMFFDLDGFKLVNDEHGHAEGDSVLKNVGSTLMSVFRNSDVVARMGGDEFCVLLTGTDTSHVDRPLQNLQDAMSLQNRQTGYSIGYSVGVVEYSSSVHENVRELMHEADQLMYDQKRKKKSVPA
jgi:diguanylate cyclase (GGDEF)-like protein